MEENKFLSIPEDFIFFDEKIQINKSELSKINSISNKSIFPKSHDNKKLEDETAKDMDNFINNIRKDLENELVKMYPELI